MVAVDVLDALALQLGQALGVEHELLEFVVDALVGGLDVDDGAELRLTDDFVVLGLTAADADDAAKVSTLIAVNKANTIDTIRFFIKSS